ncbi:MAG: hypothetical protein ACI9M9_000880 [Flavobacteriaceae bacterium]|jgi:hypothetical protein
MKTLYCLLFTITFSFSYAQPYLPMLEENNIWSVDFFSDPFGGGSTGIVTDQITVAGETVIGSQTYKSVYINGAEGSCLVREENGIIYRYDVTNSQDVIMYDFTLDVGDIFEFPQLMYESYCASLGSYNSLPEMTVVAVTTEMIANETRKVIEFDYYSESGYTCFWIEGIGSSLGFDPVGDIIDIGNAYLVCYTKNGNTYFFNDATDCDNTTIVGITDFSSEEITLYPNPVANRSILQLPAEASVDRIIILDIHGRIVKDETLSKEYYLIDVMDYRSGIYFYQVFNNRGLVKTTQFIVK